MAKKSGNSFFFFLFFFCFSPFFWSFYFRRAKSSIHFAPINLVYSAFRFYYWLPRNSGFNFLSKSFAMIVWLYRADLFAFHGFCFTKIFSRYSYCRRCCLSPSRSPFLFFFFIAQARFARCRSIRVPPVCVFPNFAFLTALQVSEVYVFRVFHKFEQSV